MKLQELILTVAAAVCLASCSTPEGAYVAVAKPNSPEAAGAKVVLLNSDLMRTLAVDKPVLVDRDPVGRLRVHLAKPDRLLFANGAHARGNEVFHSSPVHGQSEVEIRAQRSRSAQIAATQLGATAEWPAPFGRERIGDLPCPS
jgi:hypothetical protein